MQLRAYMRVRITKVRTVDSVWHTSCLRIDICTMCYSELPSVNKLLHA